jgi:hypothetical protein
MACNADAAQAQQLRAFGTAAVVRVRAARVEGAAGRWVQRAGHLALHGGTGLAGVVHLGDGIEQHARVGVADRQLSIFGKQMLMLYMHDRHQTRAVRTCIEYLLGRPLPGAAENGAVSGQVPT